MSMEEQERFEDYLELEQYIEQLRLHKSASPPGNLTPQQMPIYRMAMLFHTASPHVADPRPEFSAQLKQRLLEQMQAEDQLQREDDDDQTLPMPAIKAQSKTTREPEHVGKGLAPFQDSSDTNQAEMEVAPTQDQKETSLADQLPFTQPESTDVQPATRRKRRLPFTRRSLLTGGTVAAASLLAGAGIEHSIESQNTSNSSSQSSTLVGNVPVTWYLVTSVDKLGTDAISFATNTIVGFVMRQTENSTGEQVIAFSAACTHMGCIVQWQTNQRQFLCPCHNGSFDAAGNPINAQNRPHYLTPLPRLETKIENGNVYVKVPLSSGQPSDW